MKIIAITFAALMAGLSLTVPVAVDANQDATSGTEAAAAPEAAANGPLHEAVYVYHDNGIRDPFVPLILPTPVSEENLLTLMTETPPDEAAEEKKIDDKPAPTPTPVSLPEEIKIQCILWSPDQQIAVIDDSFAQAGDAIGDVTIMAIHEKSVEVLYEGVKFALDIPDPLEDLNKVESKKVSSAFKSRKRR